MTENNKIPTPPIIPSAKLKMSLQFWSQIINALDSQFQFMEDNNCYGKISVEFKFKNGRVVDKISNVSIYDKFVSDEKDLTR